MGLEPSTLRLLSVCSNQMSYGGISTQDSVLNPHIVYKNCSHISSLLELISDKTISMVLLILDRDFTTNN
jgi:hypothetical protein